MATLVEAAFTGDGPPHVFTARERRPRAQDTVHGRTGLPEARLRLRVALQVLQGRRKPAHGAQGFRWSGPRTRLRLATISRNNGSASASRCSITGGVRTIPSVIRLVM